MYKKFLAVLLSVVLTMSILSGCKSDETSEDSVDSLESEEISPSEDISFPLEEPITMSMFAITNGEYEINDSEAFKYVEEKTNVKWEVQSATGADLVEKRNLLFASNQYPDVFLKAGLTQNDIDKYASQELLIPLDDLIEEHAPNFKKILSEREGAEYAITSIGDKIYSFPEVNPPDPAMPVYFINTKWMDNLGLEEPKNLDELYDVLKAFKDKDANGNGDPNDEIPFTTSVSTAPTLLLPYFGVPINMETMCAVMGDELVYVPMTDQFKDFVDYIAKLYSEGLMDKNGFVQELEQQKALGASGDVLGSFFDAGAFLTVGRERDRDFKILTPFEEGVYPVSLGIVPGTFAITDACEYPEVAVAWVDQFYTEEGGRLAWMGIEGESYEIKDDGTWDWILDDHDDIGTVRQAFTIQGAANHPSIQPELWYTGMSDPNEKYLGEERNRIVEMGAEPFPTLKIDEDDTKTIASIKTDVDAYIDQYIAKVGTGELDIDSSWDEYIKTLENMGVSQMVDIYKRAYEEYKTSSK